MVALQKMFDHGIPASITLAQGILESGNGNSELARKANNHFGIKCHGWDGDGFYMDDDEKDECFRKYKRAEDSFEDHSKFLMKKRYADLFTLKITDYKGWAKGLKKAGYATSPHYATRLIAIIEASDLNDLDRLTLKDYIAMGGKLTSTDVVASQSKKDPGTSKGMEEREIFRHGREVQTSENQVNYILAKEGDDITKLASDLNIGRWQLLKYNDLKKGDSIKAGDIIYIQPKKNKAIKPYHTIKAGETLRGISQQHGIKLKKLLKRNNIEEKTAPMPGEKLKLK